MEGSMEKLAKPKDLSKEEEKYWKEAEDIVDEQYSESKESDKYYGTLSNIFKAKVEKHLGYDPFKKARERKKKREKAEKKKKKSDWIGRAHRFIKQATESLNNESDT
jgi:alkyl sulfatase BDS1-like metallo-beta-lactamase superfamily hydrolase